ncbi:MAG: redoxin domain-containing protein [Chloroflexi bacterium]|nr:redoxin domain-containing protein [Chloroflexota bacterium]
MRDDYPAFTERGAEILSVGPDKPEQFIRYWGNENIPYAGLPDPDHTVARRYRQEVNIFKLGRMPLVCVVDKNGRIRYAHYGTSMADIPPNEKLLAVIDELNLES